MVQKIFSSRISMDCIVHPVSAQSPPILETTALDKAKKTQYSREPCKILYRTTNTF